MTDNIIKEAKYSKEHYAVMSNSLVLGRQQMSLQEAKLIRILITQIVKEDLNLKDYKIKITELAKFLGVPQNNLYRDIRKITTELSSRSVKIGTNNPKQPWEVFPWLEYANYDGQGTLTISLSRRLRPYLLQLEKFYTQYPFKMIMSLNSFYAIRLYELIKMQDGISRQGRDYIDFSVDELRGYFECENKLKQMGQFKERVIIMAVDGINNNPECEYLLKVEDIKEGRRIVGFRFFIRTKPKTKKVKKE